MADAWFNRRSFESIDLRQSRNQSSSGYVFLDGPEQYKYLNTTDFSDKEDKSAGHAPYLFAIVPAEDYIYRSIWREVILHLADTYGIQKHRWGARRVYENGTNSSNLGVILAPSHGCWPWNKCGDDVKKANTELYLVCLYASIVDDVCATALNEMGRLGVLSVQTMQVILLHFCYRLDLDPESSDLALEHQIYAHIINTIASGKKKKAVVI